MIIANKKIYLSTDKISKIKFLKIEAKKTNFFLLEIILCFQESEVQPEDSDDEELYETMLKLMRKLIDPKMTRTSSLSGFVSEFYSKFFKDFYQVMKI